MLNLYDRDVFGKASPHVLWLGRKMMPIRPELVLFSDGPMKPQVSYEPFQQTVRKMVRHWGFVR